MLDQSASASGPSIDGLRISTQVPVRPGSGNAKTRMHQKNKSSFQGSKGLQGMDTFAATRSKSRSLLKKERNIRAQRRRQLHQLSFSQRKSEHFIQRQQ